MTHPPSQPAPPPPATRNALLALAGILAGAAALRFAGLSRNPPGLWYDEAIYALDGLRTARAGWPLPVFYDTEGHMREPLYVWSLAAAFATSAGPPSVWLARAVSACWGLATVAALWPVARRVFRNDGWALAAVAAFATLRWPLHFSRTIFRAGLPALFVLLTIWLFLRWRESVRREDSPDAKPDTGPSLPRAAAWGLVLGAGLYTYLSWRLVPLVLAPWLAWQAWRGWLGDRRRAATGIAVGLAVAAAVATPLVADWARHPEHFSGRTGEISLFTREIQPPPGAPPAAPDAPPRREPRPAADIAADIAGNAAKVAMVFFVRGDPEPKHDLPGVPVFDPVTGLCFTAGLLWCLRRWRRDEWAVLLPTWLGAIGLASVLSFGAPNLLRTQAASPAAALLMVVGLRWILEAPATVRLLPARTRRLAAGAVLAGFAAWQLDVYFRRFPRDERVRTAYQADLFHDPGATVAAWLDADPARTALVPRELAEHPTFAFVTAERPGLITYAPTDDLPTTGGRATLLLTTGRAFNLARGAGRDQAAQLDAAAPRLRMVRPLFAATPQGRVPWGALWTGRD